MDRYFHWAVRNALLRKLLTQRLHLLQCRTYKMDAWLIVIHPQKHQENISHGDFINLDKDSFLDVENLN